MRKCTGLRALCSGRRTRSRHLSTRSAGFSLIGLLIVIVILGLAFLVVLRMNPFGGGHGPTRADKKDTNMISGSFARGRDAVCITNLQNCRQAVEMQKTTEGKPPTTFGEIPSIKSIDHCPIGNEPYVYDPGTGAVRCPHPGHEKY